MSALRKILSLRRLQRALQPPPGINLPLVVLTGLVFVATCVVAGMVRAYHEAPTAELGYLYCSSVDSQPPIMLRGEWEYYPGAFLYPSDFKYDGTVKDNALPETVKVPGSLPQEYGFGTYRLTFRCVTRGSLFAMKTTDIRSSARIYVDSVEIGAIGDPSTLTNGSIPWNSSQYIVFPMDILRSTHEIIIHTSNYNYFKGGINAPLYFGTQIGVYELSTSARLSDIIAIVSVGLLSTLLSLLLLLRIQMGNTRYLLVFSIILALHLACSGEKLVLGMFQSIHYIAYTRLSLSLYALMGVFMALYLLDPSRGAHTASRVLNRACAGAGAAITLLLFGTPQSMQSLLLTATTVFLLLVFLSASLSLLQKLVRRKSGALFQLLGLLCWGLLFVCYELYGNGNISSQHRNSLLIVCVIGFVVSQLIYVAQRVARVYSGNERLAQRMVISDKLKDELMIITSHELRTPLHGIINITDSVVSRIQGENSAQDNLQDLELVLTLAQRMRNIVNDLYGFGGNSESKLTLWPVNLKVMVSATFEMFGYINSSRRLQFHNDIAQDAFTVLADEGKLWQVMNNLINNSIKYTRSGSITVYSRRDDETVWVSVEDTGIGMPMQDADKIFDRSSRLPSGLDEAEGLGLGLYVARQLVEKMGGEIFVERSAPGRGTCISFSLPACDEQRFNAYSGEKNVSSARQSPSPIALTTMAPANAKLLVADDNHNNLQVICRIFEDCNFIIDTADSGSSALELVERNPYDLAVLDVMMPGITGFETCQRIRARFSHHELPILLLTARDSSEDILTGFLAGANDYVIKPADSVELRARVFNLISLKQSVSNAIVNELAFLQAQIKPHFLYNAFNTISAIALTDGAAASELIDDLGVFLRKCFQTEAKGGLVGIENELEMVRAYVRIEQARFGERLRVRFDVDEETRFALPVLTVQPLVENAIRHGSMGSYGIISVNLCVQHEGGDCVVKVSDNGKGLDIDTVSAALRGEAEKNWAGIGLQNVNRRLMLQYNRPLEFQRNAAGGICVTIRIPDAQGE